MSKLILHATSLSLLVGQTWRGALIVGPSGIGKSDLALRAIEAGCRLVSDDSSCICRATGDDRRPDGGPGPRHYRPGTAPLHDARYPDGAGANRSGRPLAGKRSHSHIGTEPSDDPSQSARSLVGPQADHAPAAKLTPAGFGRTTQPYRAATSSDTEDTLFAVVRVLLGGSRFLILQCEAKRTNIAYSAGRMSTAVRLRHT